MAIDKLTVTLLKTILDSSSTRKLFTTIAASQIAELATLKEAIPNADQELKALQSADLIGANRSGEKYFVTAKGLKVACDLEQLAI
jgi:hypothetical protein